MSHAQATIRRWFAVGDPQAPLARLLDILGRRGLLDDAGQRLAPDVGLLAIGDYFDYGSEAERADAAREGTRVLEWLSSHSADQVVIIAGNHDLGRVGELASFTAASFDAAHRRAKAIYGERGEHVDREAERALLAEFPALPTAELAARDFASFDPVQRDLVIRLLRERRLRLAHAHGGILYSHAGIGRREVGVLGLPPDASAERFAEALNRALDGAFDGWEARRTAAVESWGPLDLPGLHHSGSSDRGEGVGMLYHRPVHPDAVDEPPVRGASSPARRFDARDLVPGLRQVIGHVSDQKCRTLLGAWYLEPESRGGVLRHLWTDGERVEYRHGVPGQHVPPGAAVLTFIDGGMNRVDPDEYELYPMPA